MLAFACAFCLQMSAVVLPIPSYASPLSPHLPRVTGKCAPSLTIVQTIPHTLYTPSITPFAHHPSLFPIGQLPSSCPSLHPPPRSCHPLPTTPPSRWACCACIAPSTSPPSHQQIKAWVQTWTNKRGRLHKEQQREVAQNLKAPRCT